MKIHRDIAQGTPEWFALRVGKATASEFSSVLAKGQGKMRASYLRRVIAEILTGKPVETYRNAVMDRGQDDEELAAWSYEIITGHSLERVAFIEHDTLSAGCSPDRLVIGKRRGVEIKRVIPTVQVETILAGNYPSEHKAQIQGSLWLTGYDEWDFCSYCPGMPERLRTYIFTVKRDEEYIKTIDAEVRLFLSDVRRALTQLNGQDVEGLLRTSIKVAA